MQARYYYYCYLCSHSSIYACYLLSCACAYGCVCGPSTTCAMGTLTRSKLFGDDSASVMSILSSNHTQHCCGQEGTDAAVSFTGVRVHRPHMVQPLPLHNLGAAVGTQTESAHNAMGAQVQHSHCTTLLRASDKSYNAVGNRSTSFAKHHWQWLL